MKKYLVAALLVVSSFSQAREITGIRQAGLVQVKSVQAEAIGHGFPVTEVKVTAVFGNSCEVPSAEELVSIVNYSKNFDQLIISLGVESERVCPQYYAPETVTISVGQFTKPNDGLFSKITVNGKVAR